MQRTEPALTRFWLVSGSNAARIELSDGAQHLVSTRRFGFSSDLTVTNECPEDEADMLTHAIANRCEDDDRFAGWDASEDAAFDAIVAAEVSRAA